MKSAAVIVSTAHTDDICRIHRVLIREFVRLNVLLSLPQRHTLPWRYSSDILTDEGLRAKIAEIERNAQTCREVAAKSKLWNPLIDQQYTLKPYENEYFPEVCAYFSQDGIRLETKDGPLVNFEAQARTPIKRPAPAIKKPQRTEPPEEVLPLSSVDLCRACGWFAWDIDSMRICRHCRQGRKKIDIIKEPYPCSRCGNSRKKLLRGLCGVCYEELRRVGGDEYIRQRLGYHPDRIHAPVLVNANHGTEEQEEGKDPYEQNRWG